MPFFDGSSHLQPVVAAISRNCSAAVPQAMRCASPSGYGLVSLLTRTLKASWVGGQAGPVTCVPGPAWHQLSCTGCAATNSSDPNYVQSGLNGATDYTLKSQMRQITKAATHNQPVRHPQPWQLQQMMAPGGCAAPEIKVEGSGAQEALHLLVQPRLDGGGPLVDALGEPEAQGHGSGNS